MRPDESEQGKSEVYLDEREMERVEVSLDESKLGRLVGCSEANEQGRLEVHSGEKGLESPNKRMAEGGRPAYVDGAVYP